MIQNLDSIGGLVFNVTNSTTKLEKTFIKSNNSTFFFKKLISSVAYIDTSMGMLI